MNDYLTIFEQYKDFKEILDLIDEIKKLREYYYRQQYDGMQQCISELTQKHFVETCLWNTSHIFMPTIMYQAYLNTEVFLRMIGISVLLKKGIKIQGNLSCEEVTFVESAIKAQE